LDAGTLLVVCSFVEIVVDKQYSLFLAASGPHFSRIKRFGEIHKQIRLCTNHGR
jgi:hypothetical protein